LEEIKPAFVDLVLWKPEIDSAVGALQADLGDLRITIDNLSDNAFFDSATSTWAVRGKAIGHARRRESSPLR
jgi:hypothetical protein